MAIKFWLINYPHRYFAKIDGFSHLNICDFISDLFRQKLSKKLCILAYLMCYIFMNSQLVPILTWMSD
jgi:hypothetical protein